jgi:hypothetical protein
MRFRKLIYTSSLQRSEKHPCRHVSLPLTLAGIQSTSLALESEVQRNLSYQNSGAGASQRGQPLSAASLRSFC